MNAANLFAKLSSKSSDYSMMPFSDSNAAVNIALYTKGMYRKAYLAARLVWSKDLSVHEELRQFVLENVSRVAEKENWRCKQQDIKDRIDTFIQLAMIEHYSPGIFRSQKSRYLFCNIDERDWYRTWKKRYEVAYESIRSYLDIAWGSLHE
jgi:hypothetical protein